jgi:hypothetical protein
MPGKPHPPHSHQLLFDTALVYMFAEPTLLASMSSVRYFRPTGFPFVLPLHVIEDYANDIDDALESLLLP